MPITLDIDDKGQTVLSRYQFGYFMASKKRSTSRGNAKASAAVYPVTAFTMAARNLLNMAAVCATSATILLCLLIVKRF